MQIKPSGNVCKTSAVILVTISRSKDHKTLFLDSVEGICHTSPTSPETCSKLQSRKTKVCTAFFCF